MICSTFHDWAMLLHSAYRKDPASWFGHIGPNDYITIKRLYETAAIKWAEAPHCFPDLTIIVLPILRPVDVVIDRAMFLPIKMQKYSHIPVDAFGVYEFYQRVMPNVFKWSKGDIWKTVIIKYDECDIMYFNHPIDAMEYLQNL